MKPGGVPCQIVNGQPMSGDRPIQNALVVDMLTGLPPMIGVLTVGPSMAEDVFERTLAAVRDPQGVAPFMFYVHDCLTTTPRPLSERLQLAQSYVHSCNPNYVEFIRP